MLERQFTAPDGTRSSARYSGCGAYRYGLTRRWGDGPLLAVIMLNPSTATERANDPTITRVETRARALGWPGFAVANLFALRATRPDDLFAHPDPVGPGNDRAITATLRNAGLILCAWGSDRRAVPRAATVAALLSRHATGLRCLGTCASGAPRHPLYVAAATPLRPWSPEEMRPIFLKSASSTAP